MISFDIIPGDIIAFHILNMFVSKGNFMGVPSSASVCPDPEALLVSTTF